MDDLHTKYLLADERSQTEWWVGRGGAERIFSRKVRIEITRAQLESEKKKIFKVQSK